MEFGVEGVKWEGRVHARLLSLLDYSRQLRPEPQGSAAKCKGQLSKWLGAEGGEAGEEEKVLPEWGHPCVGLHRVRWLLRQNEVKVRAGKGFCLGWVGEGWTPGTGLVGQYYLRLHPS